jgi:NAD(P)H-dependent FMN reductase
VIVTPKYNSGYPAALKNALDYLYNEWRDKPVGFVSYGGVSAGTRAVQQLKQVVTTGEDTRVRANDIMERAVDAMLDELVRLEGALRPLREPIAQAA